MKFEEIIAGIRARDEKVTQCFFFWEGHTQQHIDQLRRVDPQAAARLRRPVCSTCRPGILSVLHRLYGDEPFDYKEKVTSFYLYLMDGDKLSGIKDPQALMGWMVSTAYFYFLREKRKEEASLASSSSEPLEKIVEDFEYDLGRSETRAFVREVLDAMPNRNYAKLLDEVALEAAQYSGQEKAEVVKKKADDFGLSVDTLYVKLSLAKKQFRKTAELMAMENGEM